MKKGPRWGPFVIWRARRDYLKQPNGCFNPADFAATPLRIKMLAHFVEQQLSSSSRTPKMKKGPRWGPFVIWRARRDSNSRPLGS